MTVAAFFSIGTVIGVTIYMPLYCQTVLGVSASLSGLGLIAYMGGATLGSLVSTRFVVHMRHYMRVPIGGLIVAVVTLIVLAIDPAGKTFGEVVGLLLVLGLGLGPMYPVSTIVMQNAVKPHQLGTATGTLNFFRTLGGAIVVAMFGAIVLGEVAEGSPALTLDKLAAGQGDLALAFHWVFIAAAICLVISFACLLVVEERPLHGPLRAAESAAGIDDPHGCPAPPVLRPRRRGAKLSRNSSEAAARVSATTSPDSGTDAFAGAAAEDADPTAEESAAPSAVEAKLGRREVVAIIGGLALAMFLGALNQTIVATALPTIGRAFDDFENLSWVVIAYLLTSTLVAPLYGKLSDIYGRRGMMLVALGVFMAGLRGERGRAQHAHAHLGSRPAGDWRRRHCAAGAVDHRRRGAAARARLLSGLYRFGLDHRRCRRPGARRRHRRAFALVDDLLAQCSALPRGRHAVAAPAQAPAASRARP